jgi:hypothetical protein
MNYIKTKRIIMTIIAALMLVFLIFPGSVAAAEGFKVSAAKTEGSAGGQVTVIVTAEKAKGTEGGQFTLTFDPQLMKPVSIAIGDLVQSAENSLHMANLDYKPGKLMFMWVTANGDTKDSGNLCRITFDLIKEGTSAIGFEDLIIVAGSSAEPTAVPGQIVIGASTSGQGTLDDSEPEELTEESAADPEPETEEGDTETSGEQPVGEDDTDIRDQDAARISPYLVIIPILVIVVLAVVYWLVKKPFKSVRGKKDKTTE